MAPRLCLQFERAQSRNDRDDPGGATVLINADVGSGRTAPTVTDPDGLVCLLGKLH